MTTGSRSFGGTASEYYYYKSWSGDDGKSVLFKGSRIPFQVYKKVEEAQRIPYVTNRRRLLMRPYRDKRGYHPATYKVVNQTKYRWTKAKYVPITLFRRPKVRVATKWNAYTMNGKVVTAVKGTHPLYGAYLSPQWVFSENLVLDWNDILTILGKLASASREHEFNLGVAVGEGKQTLELVVGTITRFTGAISALRKGRFDIALRHLGAVPRSKRHSSRERKFPQGMSSKARQEVLSGTKALTSKDVSSMWLEIQYGWRPLISDVHESAKAFAAIADQSRKDTIKITHSKRKEFNGVYPATWATSNFTEIYSCNIIYIRTEAQSTLRSLGLADPRSVLWELTPFSFVADWFIPIGSYLDALAQAPNLKGNFLISYRYRTTCQAKGLDSDISFKGARFNAYYTRLNRSTSTSIPVPLPVFKPLDVALSTGHLKNAIALLHQVLT